MKKKNILLSTSFYCTEAPTDYIDLEDSGDEACFAVTDSDSNRKTSIFLKKSDVVEAVDWLQTWLKKQYDSTGETTACPQDSTTGPPVSDQEKTDNVKLSALELAVHYAIGLQLGISFAEEGKEFHPHVVSIAQIFEKYLKGQVQQP